MAFRLSVTDEHDPSPLPTSRNGREKWGTPDSYSTRYTSAREKWTTRHMLGLPDEYRDTQTPDGTTSVPLPGFENDIMGSAAGHVTDWDLDKALAGRACGCNRR